jgi:hypothetical protein
MGNKTRITQNDIFYTKMLIYILAAVNARRSYRDCKGKLSCFAGESVRLNLGKVIGHGQSHNEARIERLRQPILE